MRITSRNGHSGQQRIKVQITNEEIMADLLYPAQQAKAASRPRPVRRSRAR